MTSDEWLILLVFTFVVALMFVNLIKRMWGVDEN